MGKTSSYIVIFTGLLLIALGAAGVVKLSKRNSAPPTVRQSEPNSNQAWVLAILQRHSGGSDGAWTRFSQKGTQTYFVHVSNKTQKFDRQLNLATDGSVVRFDKSSVDLDQSYLLNGSSLLRTILQTGTRPEAKPVDGVEAASIKFQIATFGLLPVLKRLSDPDTKVFFVGATSKGNRFEVMTANGSWFFYTDGNHLIDRLEVGEVNITYGDYRTVRGMTLPFKQYVRKGEILLYEINFETFVLNPALAAGLLQDLTH
jgi:hypothetical protein